LADGLKLAEAPRERFGLDGNVIHNVDAPTSSSDRWHFAGSEQKINGVSLGTLASYPPDDKHKGRGALLLYLT
jgi:hypothetical protein